MNRRLMVALLSLLPLTALAEGCFLSGVTDQYTYFVAVDSTDFTTRETGLSSFTVRRSRNGGASAAFTTPTINETDVTNMQGVYELLLDEDMTLDAGDDMQHMTLHITQASMAPVTKEICIARPKITAGQTVTAANGAADADAEYWNGAEITTALETSAGIADAVLLELVADHSGTTGSLADVIDDIVTDTVEIGVTGLGLTAITDQTDSLTFTVANQVDSNSLSLTDGVVLVDTTIATRASQVSFTLTAGSPDDNAYNRKIAVIIDVSDSTQKTVGKVLDYVGGSKTITLAYDPGVFTIAATDNIVILSAEF